MSKYRCEYKYYHQHGTPAHQWTVVGARCAAHVSIYDNGEEFGEKYGDRYRSSIEFHSRAPIGDRAPDYDACFLLKAPCWTYGSASAGSEIWIPRWLASPHDHDGMFRYLEMEMDGQFPEVTDDDD